ncbi:MAG TPA: sulfatase-like hydrolase/transferase [Kofleriaceae bacterium]
MLPSIVPLTLRARTRSFRSLGEALRGDVGRAIAMAGGGAIGFAVVEYGLTLASYAGATRWASRLGLVALTATLALWLWWLLAAGTAAVLVAVRLVRARFDPGQARAPGWLYPPPPIAAGDARPGVAWLWATVVTALVSIAVVQRIAATAIVQFKEPQLTAALIAGACAAWLAAAVVLHRVLAIAARVAAAGLAPVLGPVNPVGRWRAAGVALAGLVAAGLAASWLALPQSRSVLPVRLMVSGGVIALGMGLGALRHARRLSAAPRPATRARRRPALALAGAALVVTTATLVWFGADLETKYIAITASPALDKLIGVVRAANDLDGDGFGSLLGEGDCAPLDPAIHPGAIDRPDNGIDENCDGHDFSLRDARAASASDRQVPERFRNDWNVLLLTIDDLRYDHTTFGGYADGPKHRDTTPRLAELAKRSVSFAFTNAPSAGTMASIPAILTSKYFHSGIALDESPRPPGTPPGILPENTTLPEIMKRKAYATGVVSSHVWWNHWGLEQGVDDYDNSIAPTDDPFRVAADRVTDHVLAWVSRHQAGRWFMWAHYIDPHGRYVAHPDVVDYGASEPDLYDAEIRWTDQEVGRLLAELSRLPSYARTIIIITSDHGDSMGEHTVPLGTHGTALYRELQHVPMIFYIPDNRPRVVHGAVTNLDIVPTVAALCGIDVHDLAFEGRSLVPQLFYGAEDRDRIVFAETNAPQKERAAISERWKLIYYFGSNLYELYDLAIDPWEHTNLAPQHPPAFATMKQALEDWMDRVMFVRDPTFNQAFRQISDVVLAAAPHPEVATVDQAIDGIAILGIGTADGRPITPGAKVDVHVYFHVDRPTTTGYRFQLAAWPIDRRAPAEPAAAAITRSPLRATAGGAFATDRWKPGDHVRERFTLTIPADWRGDAVGIGLVAEDPAGTARHPTGATLAIDPNIAVLGTLPLAASGSSPAPHP